MHDPREDIILKLGLDPVLAHEILFKHRHGASSQSFHHAIIKDWHSDKPNVLNLIFRDGGKSTIAEEAIVVMSCLRRFHNGLIIGETETRAKERLASIKHEFDTNEDITAIFGDMRGPRWQETYVELSNGVVLQAYGRGQSLRGVKHLHYRPDMMFLDDLEDEESVRTVETRQKTLDWFVKTLMPAGDPKARVRMAATPLDRDALALRLARMFSWETRTIPICYLDDEGVERSSWPDRFPMEWIAAKRREYEHLGEMGVWLQEYMMQAEDPASKVFTTDMFKHSFQQRRWEATYAVYDPARTTKATSAATGKVVGSWTGSKLIVWEAKARLWKPDEIINDIFATDETYNPVAIGVEEDGLHEFIMQPLRHAQVERRRLVPIRPLKAPRGKLDFIKSLQPFFRAGEVEFAGPPEEFADLEQQLLNFPSGRIDAPNALAYFLRLRGGLPIFEDFTVANVREGIAIARNRPLHLCVNATRQAVVGVLTQVYDGIFTVLADFAYEGDPGAVLGFLAQDAGAAGAMRMTATCPRSHFEQYDVIGLRAAARRAGMTLQPGGDMVKGREELRANLRRVSRGQQCLRVSPDASWTLRALAGGYAREPGRDQPTEGVYKVLGEALEAFAGTIVSNFGETLDEGARYDYTSDGRRFITTLARGHRHAHQN